MSSVVIPTPDDWHLHLRDDDMLQAVAPWSAAAFRYAIVMPNLVPPITDTAAAAAYRQRILAAAGKQEGKDPFTPQIALYLNDAVETDDLLAGYASGDVAAVKYYPAGATTNSEHGGTSMLAFEPVLAAMQREGIPLLVHAESTDPDVDIFDREQVFLERQLSPVCDAFPELRVTVEHISTAAGIDFVRSRPGLAGSITPHHLTRDRSDLLGSGMQPDLYCKPVINSATDRESLVEAATSAEPAFFLGTDSAPHPTTDKIATRVKAGVFNAPYALEVVAELFYQHDCLNRLGAFVSVNGAAHYGFEPAHSQVRLTRNDSVEGKGVEGKGVEGKGVEGKGVEGKGVEGKGVEGKGVDGKSADAARDVPDHITTADGAAVRIFGADEARRWKMEPVTS